MLKHSLITLVSTLVLAFAVQAHEFTLKDIQIDHPYARATVPGQTSGGAYLNLKNNGTVNDELIRVESTIAKSIELHDMQLKGDVMQMRGVKGIDLGAGQKVTMQPGGGYHVMLLGLNQQLKTGETFPMTLYFKKAGKVDVVVNVEEKAVTPNTHAH